MIGPWLTRRRMALVAVILALLLGGAALPSLVLSHPVSSAVLGDEWQCSSFAFLTSCTRMEMVRPVANRLSRSRSGGPGA